MNDKKAPTSPDQLCLVDYSYGLCVDQTLETAAVAAVIAVIAAVVIVWWLR